MPGWHATLGVRSDMNSHLQRNAILFNSLRPSDAIWRHRSGSTLARVMACCLTAPSHYLNQFWLIISKVLWHSSDGNFIRDTTVTIHYSWLENCLPKIILKSPRGQWVNSLDPGRCGSNFKSMIFKPITQNGTMGTHCEIAVNLR